MTKRELYEAMRKLEKLREEYVSRDQQPLSVPDAQRLADVVNLLNTPE